MLVQTKIWPGLRGSPDVVITISSLFLLVICTGNKAYICKLGLPRHDACNLYAFQSLELLEAVAKDLKAACLEPAADPECR